MALLVQKDVLLAAYKNVASKGLLDKDVLLVKLQDLVTNGDITQEDAQPIVDILVPPATTEISQ